MDDEFQNPIATLEELKRSPERFIKRDISGEHQIILTSKQFASLIRYLRQKEFRFDNISETDLRTSVPDSIIAFSFGDAPDVNQEIAFMLYRYLADVVPNSPVVYAQWEVADMLKQLQPNLVIDDITKTSADYYNWEEDLRIRRTGNNIVRIGLGEGVDYLTTDEIARICNDDIGGPANKTLLFCQAWHASQCWDTCQKYGLDVIGSVVVDKFSPNDPQPWVRDAFSWVLKDSKRVS